MGIPLGAVDWHRWAHPAVQWLTTLSLTLSVLVAGVRRVPPLLLAVPFLLQALAATVGVHRRGGGAPETLAAGATGLLAFGAIAVRAMDYGARMPAYNVQPLGDA